MEHPEILELKNTLGKNQWIQVNRKHQYWFIAIPWI